MDEKILIDKEKIKEICKFYGLKLTNFAEKTGIKVNELYAINSYNQSEFSRDTLIAMCKNCPEISPYWLITGEGSMLVGDNNGIIQHHNGNATATLEQSANIDKLIEMSASQQRTIEKLISKLN